MLVYPADHISQDHDILLTHNFYRTMNAGIVQNRGDSTYSTFLTTSGEHGLEETSGWLSNSVSK